jgi:SAM-dependent methyltransferase
MDLKEQEALGDAAQRHWYYRAKSAAMLRMLQGSTIDKVLDVGAGSGFFSRHLLDHTPCAAAVCVDPNYPMAYSDQQNGKPIDFVHGLDHFDGHLALMMDVLEHVPDDTALLAEYAAKMPAGSRILITVPAMPWMWSGHDVFLEHYRRYTVKGVNALLDRAGLHRIASCYYFGLTLPLAAGVRIGRRLIPGHTETPGSDMRAHGTLVNTTLLQLSRAELAIFKFNKIAGLSVFALAETNA